MSDVQQTATLVGVPVADVNWDIMRVYEQNFLNNPVGLRITTKDEPELNVRYQTLTPQNTYGIAVEHGFIEEEDHPVYAVMRDLYQRYPEAGYFIDLGMSHGLEKMWGYFETPLSIETVAEMESLPDSIRKNLDVLKKYEMKWVSVIGVNYVEKSANIYFVRNSFPNSPELSRQFLLDIDYAAPPKVDNAFNGDAFVLYLTFSWDSDKIERVSYARAGTQEDIPQHWDSQIHEFAAQVPLRGDERTFTFNTCYGQGIPSYYKIEADYRNSIETTVGPLIEGAVKARENASSNGA